LTDLAIECIVEATMEHATATSGTPDTPVGLPFDGVVGVLVLTLILPV